MPFVFIRLYSYLFRTGTVSLFPVSSYFAKRHTLTYNVSEGGTNRKSTQLWSVSKYLFIEFSKVSLFSVPQTGDSISIYLPWKVIELKKHFVSICFVSGFVLRELVTKQDLSLPLRSLKSNWTREASIVKPRIYFWVFEVTFLASVFLCIMAKRDH